MDKCAFGLRKQLTWSSDEAVLRSSGVMTTEDSVLEPGRSPVGFDGTVFDERVGDKVGVKPGVDFSLVYSEPSSACVLIFEMDSWRV